MGWEEGGSLQRTILLNCLKAVSKHPKHYGILIIVEAFFLLHTQLQRLVHVHSSEARLSVFLLPAQCSIDSLLRCHDSSHTNTITCCLIKPKKNIQDKRQTDHAHSANVQIDRQADRGTKIRLNTHGNNLHNVIDILFHITTDTHPGMLQFTQLHLRALQGMSAALVTHVAAPKLLTSASPLEKPNETV